MTERLQIRQLMNATGLAVVIAFSSISAQAAPANPSQFSVLHGGYLNIEDGATVEGSTGQGGLQPDYVVSFSDPALAAVLKQAQSIALLKLSDWSKIEKIRTLIGTVIFEKRSYQDPTYLALMSEHKQTQTDVPLSRYIECGAAVCRENGMLLHLALKAAGFSNDYIYTRVNQLGKVEGHGLVVLRLEEQNWIVDSYNGNFNGFLLEDAMSPGGLRADSKRAPIGESKTARRRIVQISNYPRVWNPRPNLRSKIGGEFIEAPRYSGPEIDIGEFIEPNELHPDVASKLYASGGAGVHIAVGTERGYIGFTMNPNATHLLLTDVDEQVVRFNQLNIALLQLCDGFEDYKRLRFARSHDDWLQRISSRTDVESDLRTLLTDSKTFAWWKARVIDSKSSLEKTQALSLSSYLNDPGKFERLYRAARAGHLQAMRLNLIDAEGLRSLASRLKAMHLKISLLDISSAWSPRYVGETAVPLMLTSLKESLDPESVLMVTKGRNGWGHWGYIAYKGRFILRATKSFFNGTNLQSQFDSNRGPILHDENLMFKTLRASRAAVVKQWQRIQRSNQPLLTCEDLFGR